MKAPSKKQQAILKFIDKFSTAHHCSPSYREIAAALELSSVATVAQHIDACVAAGYLKRVPNSARSLELIPQNPYPETSQLFKKTAKALSVALRTEEDKDAANKIEKKLKTLRAAAKILKLNLDL